MFLRKKEEQLNQYRVFKFSAELMGKLLQNESLMERARKVFENRGRFEEIWGILEKDVNALFLDLKIPVELCQKVKKIVMFEIESDIIHRYEWGGLN